MEIQKKYLSSGFTVKLPEQTKQLVRVYVKSIFTNVPNWILSLVQEHLIEKKVLDKNGNLRHEWKDPSVMKPKACPRVEIELDGAIGVVIDKKSDLYIGLEHYSTGNSKDAGNMSALLRFLIDRELRRAGVLTQRGELTAAWKGKIGNIQKVAA